MRIIICGGRDYTDRARAWEVLDGLLDEFGRQVVIVHGAAHGADALADEWARLCGVQRAPFPAEWEKYKPDNPRHKNPAGPIRNRQMLDTGADLVIAFPGGRGTADMVRQARARGVPVREV